MILSVGVAVLQAVTLQSVNLYSDQIHCKQHWFLVMSPPFGPGFDAKIALREWQQYQVPTDSPNERRKKNKSI